MVELAGKGHPARSETGFAETETPHQQQAEADAAEAGQSLDRDEGATPDRKRQHKRKTDRRADGDHTSDGANTEDKDISDSLKHRAGRREDDQQQRGRPRQPMRHADEERPPRFLKPMGMHMVLPESMPVKMQVAPAAMFMRMDMPLFPVQAVGQAKAED